MPAMSEGWPMFQAEAFADSQLRALWRYGGSCMCSRLGAFVSSAPTPSPSPQSCVFEVRIFQRLWIWQCVDLPGKPYFASITQRNHFSKFENQNAPRALSHEAASPGRRPGPALGFPGGGAGRARSPPRLRRRGRALPRRRCLARGHRRGPARRRARRPAGHRARGGAQRRASEWRQRRRAVGRR